MKLMTKPTPITKIQTRLAQTSDDLEKFHLLTEMCIEYEKMWKLRQALKTSKEALKLSHSLLQKAKKKKNDQLNRYSYYY